MQAPEAILPELNAATEELIDDIGALSDGDARGPSLLPGWTRGHVLTHLARNAEGGTRLLGWACSGVRSYEYESVAARAAAIEAGSGRPAAALIADVTETARALAEAAAVMPAAGWDNLVTWTTGHQTKAEHVIYSRHAEVLLHHVDLDIGFRPASWPPVFVTDALAVVISSLNDRSLAPLQARLHAVDTGNQFRLGHAAQDAPAIAGTQAELLAWLMGRSDGGTLARAGEGPLPPVPSIYYA
jgi:maleylpyruvate isomerase